MVAKNLMARNKPENLTLIIDQFLLLAKELLSLNIENTRYEELKSTLAQYDYLFLSADNALSVTYKIKIAEQLKLEIKEKMAERKKLKSDLESIKEETKLDIATRGILNEFLSLAERSSRYKEIKLKLFHVFLHNSPEDNHSYLTELIFNSVTNIDEAVQTAVA